MHAQAHRLDLAYNPRLSTPNLQASLDLCASASARTRERIGGERDVAFGPSPAERLDVFPAAGTPRAALLFIHGGYWRAGDKAQNHFVANAVHAAGVTVVTPNYTLCPAVTVADIVLQMVRASAWLWRHARDLNVPRERLYVCGHSAGGHLATMMQACRFDWFDPALPRALFRAGLSISGLYDLRPLVRAPFLRAEVRLTPALARKVSPALIGPASAAPLVTARGALEPSGFTDQEASLAARWSGVHHAAHVLPGHDHFAILLELDDPASVMSGLLRELTGL